MITVRHQKVCVGQNDPTKEVSSDAWNEWHVIAGLGTAAEADVGDFAAAGHNHDAAYDALGAAATALTTALAADFSGDYGDLANKPTLGDAAGKNVGTGAGDVAAGNHTHPGGGSALDSWPVGSVYIAVDSTSPATRFGGGTWAAFGAGRVLVGINGADSDFDTAEETGGAKTVTLTAAQSGLPQHTHIQDAHSHTYRSITSTTGSQANYEHGTIDTSSTANENSITTNGATATNQNAGPTDASQAHNNMPPYIVVYMWKRTA